MAVLDDIEDYEEYVKGLSGAELEEIISSIDREKYPERFAIASKYHSEVLPNKLSKEPFSWKEAWNETKTNAKKGLEVLAESTRAFRKHPRLLAPLVFAWVIYAPTILYLKFFMAWEALSYLQAFSVVFLVIVGFASLLSISSLVLLELLQQLNENKPPSLLGATIEMVHKDLVKTLPLTLVWAILWFAITVVEIILSRFRKRGDEEDLEFTPQNAAETLGGFESLSITEAVLEALKKGIRMIFFLILPAIAWEDKGSIKAFKKGLGVARQHKGQFAAGYVFTELAAAVVFLPPALLFYFSRKFDLPVPDVVWFATIIYLGFAWSYSMFLEQMFAAELYLWHLQWEKVTAGVREKGQSLPRLVDVPRPSILGNFPSLFAPDETGNENS